MVKILTLQTDAPFFYLYRLKLNFFILASVPMYSLKMLYLLLSKGVLKPVSMVTVGLLTVEQTRVVTSRDLPNKVY